MLPTQKLRILFAINPVSGGVAKHDWADQIRAFFADQPHDVMTFELDGQTDEAELQRHLTDYQPHYVVAVGGDGTVRFVAEYVLGTPMTLGIIPAGSANGMARELNLPSQLTDALNVVASGQPTPIDVIRINNQDLCLHLSDIGMNAQLVKYYHDNRWRGKLGYLRGVLRVLLRKRPLQVSIQTGRETVQRAAYMVVLANASMYGTGAVINPEGDVTDGSFEVVVIRRFSWWEVLKMFWRFQPFDPKKTEIFQASRVRIETRRKAYFQIDGEYRGRIQTIDAHILHGKLRVLLPTKQE